MATRSDRPRFFEGQFLGAADLEAVVGYARDLSREHLLAAHPWGIATGLDLVDAPAAGGGGAADYFILPGLAWDGYGRALLVLSPVQVQPALFTGLADGDQMVWLRYDETPFRGLREGFGACGTDEAFARIRESFAIEAGPFSRVTDRQRGVSVAGVTVADARLVPRQFDAAAAILGDGSVPYQAFPADDARWLIRQRRAWANGAPGIRAARSLWENRVLADAGLFDGKPLRRRWRDRLRDRCQPGAGETPTSPWPPRRSRRRTSERPDPDDSTRRLPSSQPGLVWVEGTCAHRPIVGAARLRD